MNQCIGVFFFFITYLPPCTCDGVHHKAGRMKQAGRQAGRQIIFFCLADYLE